MAIGLILLVLGMAGREAGVGVVAVLGPDRPGSVVHNVGSPNNVQTLGKMGSVQQLAVRVGSRKLPSLTPPARRT